ncbi:helix-turn-helix domain-containing protein [Trinickia diaoshuihuensis]|uniref:helix-turn-helix domain-containing protein n=1 Tax=Trinickia diaoshuihuensis TaxID=2292265 RepID=UPI003B8384B1
MHIDRSLHDDLSIHQISDRFGISERTLARRFVNEIRMPIGSYILNRRLEEARRLLQATDMPIAEIHLSVGFSSASHFATSIRRRFKMSPSALRG